MSNKSAKDLAFEKERAKYRKQIRELETELKKERYEKFELKGKLVSIEEKCTELQDWIDRLLEYTEMSEDDMKAIIKKEKTSAEIIEHLKPLLDITSRFGGAYL